ncbi:hypothetical protein [Nocardioides sp. B-3]|uniref:hypothetical protein n=1 Tax=Nocardioides sp. B-3 TaxID=2895565 RepID=UPI0021537197|nr:hypothetical protein [Nocardioides sp. B-3]UUZ60775.1 hypothetical protein LP418_08430 [Nocardioides sp. B-3]
MTSIPPNLLSAGNASSSVTTVIVAASQNPGLLEPVEPVVPEPTKPDPVSGQGDRQPQGARPRGAHPDSHGHRVADADRSQGRREEAGQRRHPGC